jgi:hypothetical protein
MSRIITLDDSHVYRVDGLITAGVNEILLGAGLIDDQWFTEASRYRGSVVHALCQFDNEGDLDETWIDEQENALDLRGYLQAHRRFKEETGFVATCSEEQVYNPSLHYCGTLDERGPLNGKPCLADIKSGVVSRITRYQTVAYLGTFPDPWNWTRLAVGLKPDGNYNLKVYGPRDYRADWAKWTSIVDVYGLRRELGMIDYLKQRKGQNTNVDNAEGSDVGVGVGGLSNAEYYERLGL